MFFVFCAAKHNTQKEVKNKDGRLYEANTIIRNQQSGRKLSAIFSNTVKFVCNITHRNYWNYTRVFKYIRWFRIKAQHGP